MLFRSVSQSRYSGYSGDSGTSGYSGVQGTSGFSGAQGTSGFSGYSGYSSYSGVSGYSGYSSYSGISGYSGDSGTSGYSGVQGISGFSGIAGKDGNFGGASFDYIFDTSTIADSPGQGKIRFDSITLSTATSLYIDSLDAAAKDLTNYLQSIDDSTSLIKGQIKISLKTDIDNYVFFSINGISIDNTGWFTIPIIYLSGADNFINDSNIIITFARTGDKGDQGIPGFSGYSL